MLILRASSISIFARGVDLSICQFFLSVLRKRKTSGSKTARHRHGLIDQETHLAINVAQAHLREASTYIGAHAYMQSNTLVYGESVFIATITRSSFLGAAKHLYKRVCPSVRPSVRTFVSVFQRAAPQKPHRVSGIRTCYLKSERMVEW